MTIGKAQHFAYSILISEDNISCQNYEYRCATGHCLYFDKRCNGQEDCRDGSDEQNCGILIYKYFLIS